MHLDRPAFYSRPMPAGAPPQPLRILVASGDLLFARRLLADVSLDGRASVVGTATSSDEAARLAEELSPDVVLVDHDLPPSGPLGAIEAIAEVSAARAIVFVDGPQELDWRSPASERILAFVSRTGSSVELAAVVCEVAALSLALEAAAR